MAKNRFSLLPNQQTPSMSPAHSHIVGTSSTVFDQDEDDDDICPVCDGECACDNRPRIVPQPMTLNQYSSQRAGSSSSTISSVHHSPPKPSSSSLKIKLTVPQKLLGNKNQLLPPNKLKKNQGMTFASARGGETQYGTVSQGKQTNLLKRRGRPPKAAVVSRDTAKSNAAARSQSASPPPSKFSQTFMPKNVGGGINRKKSGPSQNRRLKAAHASPKRSLKRKRGTASEDDDESLSNISDIDYEYEYDDDDDDDSVQFPTFLSASVLSSLESSSSSDSDSFSFCGDSDIEEEEEKYIVSQVHEKARLRRELLGDDSRRGHGSQGDWVIRPRKKSVDPSDNEMTIDSDATEDEEEEEEEDPDEDDEETDGKGVGAGRSGLVTAWSDDDESSFDADLFFDNLTDSESGDSNSSCSRPDEAGEEGDHSDMETSSHIDTTELISQRQEMENLQLEVTQGWDGRIVFTNGLNDGRGILDIDFEVNASQFMAEENDSPARDSDVSMSSASPCASEGDVDEEIADGAEPEGDTTDEELVGEDDLPNERAMQMFSLPFSVSAINPLSTVSPVVSPAPPRRIFGGGRGLGSPKPEDILAGKNFWDSDFRDDKEETRRARSGSQGSSQARGPRTGLFVPVQETRKAIIDGTKAVPSPHPRFRRRRSSSSTAKINAVEQMLRRHLLNNISRTTPTFTTASELLSPLTLLSSDNDFGSPSPSQPLSTLTEETEPLTESIELDDVLDSSLLAPDSSETDDKLSSGKHLQNLDRWDLISVGAFKQTRENGGWSSDNYPRTPHSSMDYTNIMKASPLSAIMWPKEKERARRRRNLSAPMAISPVILPVGDGDRTPTGAGNQHQYQHGSHKNDNRDTNKPRKESKRERKLKKKTWGPVHHQHSHHHHWHSHQHHPNSKTRASASNQRSLSAVPPFSL